MIKKGNTINYKSSLEAPEEKSIELTVSNEPTLIFDTVNSYVTFSDDRGNYLKYYANNTVECSFNGKKFSGEVNFVYPIYIVSSTTGGKRFRRRNKKSKKNTFRKRKTRKNRKI